MNERRCWRAIVDLPEEMSLGELNGIMRDLNSRPGLTVMFNAEARKLTLFLVEPTSLQGAPSGTHDFARGWLAHAAAARASAFLKPLDWEPVKWYDNGVVMADKSREGFRL